MVTTWGRRSSALFEPGMGDFNDASSETRYAPDRRASRHENALTLVAVEAFEGQRTETSDIDGVGGKIKHHCCGLAKLRPTGSS